MCVLSFIRLTRLFAVPEALKFFSPNRMSVIENAYIRSAVLFWGQSLEEVP